MQYVLGYSGGKDSTATLIYLIKELKIVPVVTFQDTGNESKITYDYVDYISGLLNQWTGNEIIRLKGEYDFLSLAVKKMRFPSNKARFCTEWLKIVPFLRWIEQQEFSENCISVTGIRKEESAARSKRKEFEPNSTYGRPLWNPLIDWRVDEVFKIHEKYGVEINPLYKKGFKRVGCFPCVNSGRLELSLIARHFPERIKEIREWEKTVAEERGKKIKKKDAVKREFQSYFFPRRYTKIDNKPIIWNIDQHVAWATKTEGGQMELGDIKEKSTICAYAGLGICE